VSEDKIKVKTGEPESSLKKIVAHAKEYGFIYPSSEIYDGLQAVYDYGPYGVELKNNLKQIWWQAMTRLNDNVVGLDAAIFMHPLIWKASGHVDSFNDPMIDNKDSKKRYRADVLIEEHAETIAAAGEADRAKALVQKMGSLLGNEDLEGVRQLIIDEKIVCPVSKTTNWTEVRQFNLMFSTKVGSVADAASLIYLRPETAQGIFVNFLNVQKTARQKIPFGIAQIGKAFRTEIVARQFIFRMREFEQMEMQFFVRPGEEMEWFEHWKATRLKWHHALGIEPEKLNIYVHDKLAHYANAAVDIQYHFPFGLKEVEGIHSRTDFDLKSHQELSGKKLQYFDPELNKNYIPFVIETSIGVDRLFLMILSNAYTEDTGVDAKGEEKIRIYLKISPVLAPVKAAILPLVKKDGLPEKARTIYENLKLDFNVVYDESAAIGKRYTRQDLIGTPFCIAVDHQTLEDDTVTIRYRDTTEQIRVKTNTLHGWMAEETSVKKIFKQIL
jgi:glycyl-tRNA synthetase